MVILDAIKFNYDSSQASHDALNIRRSRTQPVDVPEWRRGSSVNPEDSRAAYAIRETHGNVLTIQAQFHLVDPGSGDLEIRAVEPLPTIVLPGWLIWLLFLLFLFLGLPIPLNILGRVKTRKVTFDQFGRSDFLRFELQHVPLWSLGRVGTFDMAWRWQYRLAGSGTWSDFAASHHRIHVVLTVPRTPWQQLPRDSDQLPWTEALDYACSWASGQATESDAATAVTRRVIDTLGLTYDMGSGAPAYSGGTASIFDLTQFLDYLRTGGGLGNTVNCSDCATIVTTFSNVVGCDLHASRMGWSFDLNKIRAIGQAAFGCPFFGCGFSFHEVAWTGQGNEVDHVFDACLKVDGDNDPWSQPHTELLATDVPFSTFPTSAVPFATPFTASSYRERLCTNAAGGIPRCLPDGPWPGTGNGRREVR